MRHQVYICLLSGCSPRVFSTLCHNPFTRSQPNLVMPHGYHSHGPISVNCGWYGRAHIVRWRSPERSRWMQYILRSPGASRTSTAMDQRVSETGSNRSAALVRQEWVPRWSFMPGCYPKSLSVLRQRILPCRLMIDRRPQSQLISSLGADCSPKDVAYNKQRVVVMMVKRTVILTPAPGIRKGPLRQATSASLFACIQHGVPSMSIMKLSKSAAPSCQKCRYG